MVLFNRENRKMKAPDRVAPVYILRKAGQDIIHRGQHIWLMSMIHCFKGTIPLIRHSSHFYLFSSKSVSRYQASKRCWNYFHSDKLQTNYCKKTLAIITSHRTVNIKEFSLPKKRGLKGVEIFQILIME